MWICIVGTREAVRAYEKTFKISAFRDMDRIHPAYVKAAVDAKRTKGFINKNPAKRNFIHTHNALVVNEFEPQEIVLVAMRNCSLVHCKMNETKNFLSRLAIYAVGELWLTYCDGQGEKDLIP